MPYDEIIFTQRLSTDFTMYQNWTWVDLLRKEGQIAPIDSSPCDFYTTSVSLCACVRVCYSARCHSHNSRSIQCDVIMTCLTVKLRARCSYMTACSHVRLWDNFQQMICNYLPLSLLQSCPAIFSSSAWPDTSCMKVDGIIVVEMRKL